MCNDKVFEKYELESVEIFGTFPMTDEEKCEHNEHMKMMKKWVIENPDKAEKLADGIYSILKRIM